MEGCSVEEARNAQRAAASCNSCNSQSQQNNTTTGSASANVATTPSPAPTETVDSVEINGKTYYSVPLHRPPHPHRLTLLRLQWP
jgi:hypothetical protein